MNVSTTADILIAIVILGWVIYRQFTWQVVNRTRLWRMPVILTIVGIAMLAQTKSLTAVSPVDLGIFAIEFLIAVGLGAAMGSLARFRTRAQLPGDVDTRRGDIHDPTATVIESRTGGLGVALWIVLILIRVAIEIAVTHYLSSAFLAATGTIVLVIAVNRAARAFVVGARMERNALVTA